MNLQWIQMRIAEEKERRSREDVVRARLPLAVEELRTALGACAAEFNKAFQDQAVDVAPASNGILVSVRQQSGGSWSNRAKVTVSVNPELPGLAVTNGGDPIAVQVGMLAGDRIFYKSGERYLSIEELTKLILDRALFPGLKD